MSDTRVHNVNKNQKKAYGNIKTFSNVVALSSTAATPVATGYTVASGKTFYITDISFKNSTTGNSVTCVVQSTTTGATPVSTGIYYTEVTGNDFPALNIGSEPFIQGNNSLTLQFTASSATATNVTYFVSGYEV